MKRSGKARPPAKPGAEPSAPGPSPERVGPAGASDSRERRAERPTPVESIAGEEDPGSALEQFSDLMQGAPVQGDAAAPAAGPPQPRATRSRGSSEIDAESSPSLKKAPDRPA